MSHCIPKGFQFAGVACGLKSDPSKLDLTLIAGAEDIVAAGVYTQNLVQAASVRLNRNRTPGNRLRGVVINSGNANACTGEQGESDTRRMTQLAADACHADAEQMLVMSTGIIGVPLPMERIERGIRQAGDLLNDTEASLLAAARGMLTTDRSEKIASREFEDAGSKVRVAGIAKGAGMISPRMATMLAVVMTDATLSPVDAQRILEEAVDQSFNCISVDGHTSTSDTVLLLASGKADGGLQDDRDFTKLQAATNEVCATVAKMIPDDGEGASHCMTIDVCGCASRADAWRIAKSVGDSPLVKTGIAGCDPNWGRIVSAAGYAGVPFDPQRFQLAINGVAVYRDGGPLPFDAASLSSSMREKRDVLIELSFEEGDASVRFWASDLTVDYVRFNSEYTT